MRISTTLLAVFATIGLCTAQNPYVRAGSSIGVINDPRARNVGDILTVVVQEQQSVKNEDKVERRNDTSLAARLESFSLSDQTFKSNTLPRIDIRKEQDFNGEAKQNSTSDVRASIAVIVVDVQPNGNLVVAGTRSVTVNDETRSCASAASCASSTSPQATRSAARRSPTRASPSPAKGPTRAR